MRNAKEEYLEQAERNKKDAETLARTVEELIDLHFIDFCTFCEGRNIGELMGFRALLQTNLDRVDVLGKQLIENVMTTFGKEERIRVGSVFALTAKIQDRMGYIDYLVKQKKIK